MYRERGSFGAAAMAQRRRNQGRLLRRSRIDRDNREVIIIDNTLRDRPGRFADDVVVLPPPPLPIPRERYIVDADQADESLIYETITAPPIAAIPQVRELNIGHFLIGEAIFVGLAESVRRMRAAMDEAR